MSFKTLPHNSRSVIETEYLEKKLPLELLFFSKLQQLVGQSKCSFSLNMHNPCNTIQPHQKMMKVRVWGRNGLDALLALDFYHLIQARTKNTFREWTLRE